MPKSALDAAEVGNVSLSVVPIARCAKCTRRNHDEAYAIVLDSNSMYPIEYIDSVLPSMALSIGYCGTHVKMKDSELHVTLTKMCELHAIRMPRKGELTKNFQLAFPTARYDEKAGEWRMVWKKGAYAESNARLETFFSERGVTFSHVDKC